MPRKSEISKRRERLKRDFEKEQDPEKAMSVLDHSQLNTKLRREELRGLFTLGLLAILVVVRFQTEHLMVKIGQSSLALIPFINFTIVTWSLYAFFMV